ncbi:MAG: TIGR01777 family oxidoreductase [Calditrichia bacterium]
MAPKIIITGASGFIGTALSSLLHEKGYDVYALSRHPGSAEGLNKNEIKIVGWDGRSARGWGEHADGALAIINLAGDNIASGIWTNKKKKRILESRLQVGEAVSQAINKARQKPQVLIQASAIGFYGSRGDEILDETSPAGNGFLAEVTENWERSVRLDKNGPTRKVIIRIGIVLGKNGGLLSRVVVPFKLFVGGHMGSGRQWFSWIHLEDLTRAILFLIEQQELSGTFNLTAPEPIKSNEFYQLVGKQLNRPSWFHLPASLLRLALGDMAKEMLLPSQRVLPRNLTQAGYQFIYSGANKALEQILKG